MALTDTVEALLPQCSRTADPNDRYWQYPAVRERPLSTPTQTARGNQLKKLDGLPQGVKRTFPDCYPGLGLSSDG